MTEREFENVFKKRVEKLNQVLIKKAGEYSRGGDRLSNFKKAAGALGCSPESALLGMWMKHVISITDLVSDIESGKVAEYELWDEKITDAINYLILLEALVLERLNSKEITGVNGPGKKEV
jgi:hypothetical protein